MCHLQVLCNADFMGKHERLAGVRRVCLIKEFHYVLESGGDGLCLCIVKAGKL
jgi:hypothetical protein